MRLAVGLALLFAFQGCGPGLCLSPERCTELATVSRLAYTGRSVPTGTIAARTFDEGTGTTATLNNPAWTLTGECDVALGSVTVAGEGILTPFETPCDPAEGGTFQAVIHYLTTEPAFATARYFYGRKQVTIAQTGVDPIPTYLFQKSKLMTIQEIDTPAELSAMVTGDENRFYLLTGDINLATVSTINNWTPMDDFRGVLEGNDFAIQNLHQSIAANAGFFTNLCSVTSQPCSVQNLNFTNAIVQSTAGIAGILAATVSDSPNLAGIHAQGTVSATTVAGGLIGQSSAFSLRAYSLHYSGGTVTAPARVGGIVGQAASTLYLDTATVSGTVAGGSGGAGGIVGQAGAGYLSRIQFEGTMGSTGNQAGGLVGTISTGEIRFGSARAAVSGAQETGGLVGHSDAGIYDSYFVGSVSGSRYVGGAVGLYIGGNPFERTYTRAQITGTINSIGPLYGSAGAISAANNYYLSPTTCTLCDSFGGGSALSAAQMQSASNFANYDFTTVWTLPTGATEPQHLWSE